MKTKTDKKAKRGTLCLPARTVREMAVELRREVEALIRQGMQEIVFDLTEATLVDSAVLGALIHVRRDYPVDQVAMVLYAPHGYVREIIENAGLASLFIVKSSKEA
ncbi:MAG: STAS domain-containing protein [Fibrobacterota bacterium]